MSSTESPAASERGNRRPRDMVLSLAVLLVPIALLLIFYRVVLDGDKPVSVDIQPALDQARNAAVFEVAVPQGLGDDWHAQTAFFRRVDGGATLRIGYSDPGSDPVQLIESNVPTSTLIPAELGEDPEAVGTLRTGARTWQKYEARKGEIALVLIEKGRTIIVAGSDKSDHLEELASALS
ncbi:DUF4245 domain-containing protein [Actinoplanes sp. NPDC051494]|uniref:DUF4245 domain-containing protein n=1 Tax=Actinoplanes sp. NPDC051494 TaxID=3363907 RepID=UPI00379321CC